MSSLSFEEFELVRFATALKRRRPSFFKEAACTNEGLEVFFPKQGQSAVLKEAKAICMTCPVRYECLSYAINNDIEHGVWGGSSASERRDWLRQGFTPEEAWDSMSLTEE